jgi:hypothetical protein
MKKRIEAPQKIGWMPLERVVDMCHIDDYDDAQVMRQRFRNWVLRGYKKLSLNLLRQVQSVILPVSPMGTANLPENYQDWAVVGYEDACGEIIPMAYRPAAEEVMMAPEHICCKDAACKVGQYETTTAPGLTIAGVQVDRVIKTYVHNGQLVREINEPVANYTGVGPAYTMEKRVEKVCAVDVRSCGCVAATPEVVGYLRSYNGYCNCPQLCTHDEFDILEEARVIKVDPSIRRLYLKYIAYLPCYNGVVYVPEIAAETLVAFALYMRDRRRAIAAIQKQMSYQHYLQERKEMRKNLLRIKPQVILAANQLIPSL